MMEHFADSSVQFAVWPPIIAVDQPRAASASERVPPGRSATNRRVPELLVDVGQWRGAAVQDLQQTRHGQRPVHHRPQVQHPHLAAVPLRPVVGLHQHRHPAGVQKRHLGKIQEAYDLIAEIVDAGQKDGAFRDSITPNFAAMAFYGAIEQVLTAWIFGLLPQGDEAIEQAKSFVVETICGGLESPTPSAI